MKQINLISLLVLSFIVVAQCSKPMALGKLDNSRFKKASALTAALILKRLGSKQSTTTLFKKIKTQCVHLRFLGRKLYRKFRITKKLKKSSKQQKSFATSFVKFVLRRLLSCKVVSKNTLSYKLKSALRRVTLARRHPVVISNVLRLARTFRGPKINPKKKRNPRVPKLVKKFSKKSSKKNKNKKLKKAVKKLKGVRKLKKSLVVAQKKCRSKGFKRNSASCKKARRLSRVYRRKAGKVKKIVVKNCRKLKTACFKRNWKCKKMFRLCKKAKKITKSLRSTKATHFARLFSAIIKNLN